MRNAAKSLAMSPASRTSNVCCHAQACLSKFAWALKMCEASVRQFEMADRVPLASYQAPQELSSPQKRSQEQRVRLRLRLPKTSHLVNPKVNNPKVNSDKQD